MSKIADRPRGTESLEVKRSPNPEEIRREMDSVLASPVFHGTKRCQRFLEYVCEKSLAGEAAGLKERSVAIDVFGRSPESDLSDDTIVRVGAREVRKRLAQYYVTEEGAASGIRIDLVPGSYAPEFRYVPKTIERPLPLALAEQIPEPMPEPGRQLPGTKWKIAVVGTVILLAAFTIWSVKYRQADTATKLFTTFWNPVYLSNEPLLLVVGNPIVYHPSARAAKLSEDHLPAQKIPFQRPLQLSPENVNGTDMIPVLNQYVGFGDMVAATEISSMMARRQRETRVRMSANVSFADMRKSPVVLIGAFTNRWTMELGQSWRFQFGRTADGKAMIFDAKSSDRQWSIPALADGLAALDYILISRIRSSSTGGFLIVAAGLKQFGTEAAGRLLADPSQLSPLLAKLPPGWENRNLQLVLLSRVIGNAPGQPDLIASQIW